MDASDNVRLGGLGRHDICALHAAPLIAVSTDGVLAGSARQALHAAAVSIGGIRYRLVACLSHQGSPRSGHEVAIIPSSTPDTYHVLSGTERTVVDENEAAVGVRLLLLLADNPAAAAFRNAGWSPSARPGPHPMATPPPTPPKPALSAPTSPAQGAPAPTIPAVGLVVKALAQAAPKATTAPTAQTTPAAQPAPSAINPSLAGAGAPPARKPRFEVFFPRASRWMEICSENDDLDGDVSNFVMMHAEIKRNDDPFLRFLNRDISEKHLRYTDLDSDFKVLTQKMLPELAKLFGYITVHKQRVVSRALLKTIVEMLGSLEREMLVSSMTDFFYQVLGSVTWHAGQSDLESISSESSATPSQPSFSEVALGLQERTGCQPLEVTTVHPCGPGPFGNPFAHQPAAPTAPSTPVPDPVVAKPPASSRTPAPASAKG
ncbi:hypothetical protein PAPYR_11667 [Paratrimastix pyriformis]|uniref:Uncharacterized protein n=1 Tax=Paratrimastix pyriformis TaxID=342808 RepID=A0ABQ8U4Z9_9EUKA|nr:hypothetical protein PAPYR_11667 [Paratrimastix pyriformis]